VEWHDIQLDAYAPVTGIQIVVNGKNARSQGVELEVQAAVTNELSATVGGSYTDAHLTQDFIKANFVGRQGDRLPLVPKKQLTARWTMLFRSRRIGISRFMWMPPIEVTSTPRSNNLNTMSPTM